MKETAGFILTKLVFCLAGLIRKKIWIEKLDFLPIINKNCWIESTNTIWL